MTKREREILNNNGWTIEDGENLHIRHTTGAVATGLGAKLVIEALVRIQEEENAVTDILTEMESETILRAFAEQDYRLADAARVLGLSEAELVSKLQDINVTK